MGLIYEMSKENYINDDYDFDNSSASDYISFPEFIELLEVYSSDRRDVIANFLLSSDDFLKLNFYSFGSDFDYIKPKKYSYDFYKNEDEPIYPTKDFLLEVSEFDFGRDFNEEYWKIEDIIALEIIQKINLDEKTFERYYDAIQHNDPIRIIEMQNEIADLKSDITANPNEYSKLKAKFDILKKEFEGLQKQLKIKAISDTNQTLHIRTANNAGKIISALASELLGIDITQPYANESNGKIQKAIERQGNTLSNDAIAHWLEIAHEQSK